MSQLSKTRVFVLVSLLTVALAIPGFSQGTNVGAITARAQDNTGAVIPGVEVTISSPQMIGGTRVQITDESGTARFTELVLGTYRVSFSLPGFKTLNIDNNVVVTGRTLTVPGVMEVATVAEEVTVTSTAPTIDLEASTVAVNWDLNKLNNLPYSRSLAGLTTMIPGLFQTNFDVGGSSFGTSSGVGARTYGRSGNNVVAIDGLVWDQGYADWGAFEEVNVITASKGADQMNAGVTINQTLKSGSNQWHWAFNQDLEKGGFQSVNVDDALRNAGYPEGSAKFTTLRETYGDISGPILRDKFWFYFSYRDSYGGNFEPGSIRMSDGAQQEFFTKLESPTAKLTYQLTDSMKIDTSWQIGRKWQPYRGLDKWTPAEGSQNQDSYSTFGPNLKYTWIVGPKMTLTAGINRGGYWWPDYHYNTGCLNFRIVCTDASQVRRIDIHDDSGGNLGPILTLFRRPIRWTRNADVSWFSDVAGKNNELKFGYYSWWDKGYTSNFGYPNQQNYRYEATDTQAGVVNPTPADILARFDPANADSVVLFDYPNRVISRGDYLSFYIDDKLTWNRKLTLKFGARFERFSSMFPEQDNTGEGPFATAVTYPERKSSEFPVYTSLVPRASFVYDVTGEGKLAIKASYGRYISSSSSPNSLPGPGAGSVNPNQTKSCRFNGWNGEIPFIPVPGNYTTISNCSNGTWDLATRRFVANALTTRFDTLDLDANYLDEYTAGVEIGFNRDYSMRINVVRKFDFSGTKTLNVARPFEAYTDLRTYTDPGQNGTCPNRTACGGGTSVTGSNLIYTWAIPSSDPRRSITDNLITNTRDGEGKDQFTAYEFTFNKQFSNGWSALGSYTLDFAHSHGDDPTTPSALWYDYNEPTWNQAIKMNGQYELPWGFVWSGTFTGQTQGYYNRTIQVRNAANENTTVTVARRVGRLGWVKLWDNRLAKRFTIGDRHTIEGTFDLFNTLNANTITDVNEASGANFERPDEILPARVFKLGIKYRF